MTDTTPVRITGAAELPKMTASGSGRAGKPLPEGRALFRDAPPPTATVLTSAAAEIVDISDHRNAAPASPAPDDEAPPKGAA